MANNPPILKTPRVTPLEAAEVAIPVSEATAAAIRHAAETSQDAFTYQRGESINDGSSGYSSGPIVGTSGNINQIAQETIRQALGWRYRSDDVRGFSAAINRAFSLTENEDGLVEWAWKPQTYAIQADLGEITGAQASIFEQAKVAINFILPLLDGLQSLRADSDEDDIEAVTGIIRLKLNAILTELGRVGGPRVQRVDLVFEELFGLAMPEIKDSGIWLRLLKKGDVEQSAYSLLRQLGEELGLDPELANTVEEERDYTNYLIVIDSVVALRTAWEGKRKYFNRNGASETFLGTQLVWLSRQIEVVAELVRASYVAMDSVNFGAQERQATDIEFVNFGEGQQPQAAITVGDLLDWVETFATQEGPQLLQEGGKDGVLAFRSTVARLEQWVEAASKFSESTDKERQAHAPRSFFTVRVSRALCEIANQLAATERRTDGITRSVRSSDSKLVKIAKLPPPQRLKVHVVAPENLKK